MRFKLISCEVLLREMCSVVACSPHQVDLEFLPKGLHDLGGAPMCGRLQEAVDGVDASRYDAVLLGYGLCGNGLAGLTARTLPLVAPRAHDCIALLMGGRDRYQQYFQENSGVYYRSTGWLERGEELRQDFLAQTRQKSGVGQSLEELIARYGEDNGRYLYEEFTAYQRAYRKLTYITTGLEPDDTFQQRARNEAATRGWSFEQVTGDLRLFRELVAGDWNEDNFVVVPPGWRFKPVYDERVLDKEPAA